MSVWPAREQCSALALGSEPERLGGHDLADGERVVALDDVDVTGADASGFVRQAGGRADQLESPDVLAAMVPQPARAQHGRPDHDLAGGAPRRRQHGRSGAVGDRAALQQRERVGDHARGEHLVDGVGRAVLGAVVVDGVAVVLHRDQRQVTVGQAVDRLVARRSECVEAGKRETRSSFWVGRLRMDRSGEVVGHLLDADGEHVVETARARPSWPTRGTRSCRSRRRSPP